MGLTDMIAAYIKQLAAGADGVLELRRTDVAGRFNCAPSQINYVISTRFTPEHGYLVTSRRGGGGYIRISRAAPTEDAPVMHTVNAIGGSLDARTAAALIENLENFLKPEICLLLNCATDNAALMPAPPGLRDELRASILKRCLLKIIM